MGTAYLDIQGCLTFNTDRFKDEDEVFEFLKNNGIQFQGGYDFYTVDGINNDVQILKDIITNIELRNIVISNASIYPSKDVIKSAAETMEQNFGTLEWNSILKESLTQYKYDKFVDKYTNVDWQISDFALGDIGRMLAEKIRKMEE